MFGDRVFKKTQIIFDVPGNWPGVVNGGQFSIAGAAYVRAVFHSFL